MSVHPTTDRVAQDPADGGRSPRIPAGAARPDAGERTVPRPRWPRPTPGNLLLGLVWLAGIAIATLVPAMIVSPTALDPDPARVWLAFAASALGILVFAVAGVIAYRRTGNGSLLAWALIPGVSIGASAVIFTATLLSI